MERPTEALPNLCIQQTLLNESDLDDPIEHCKEFPTLTPGHLHPAKDNTAR